MRELEMKRGTIWMFAALLTAFSAATLFGQTPDISGTWIGDTEMPNSTDTNHVTLILKKADASYSGTITMAKAKDAAIENFAFEDEDTFNFEFVMPGDNAKIRVKVKLDIINDRLLGNKLMGGWVIEDGTYGSLDLQRSKWENALPAT
jgi:hypothetical protein